MRPTIQMIFRVNEVRERPNGGLMVLGWVPDSRDGNGKWHTVDVTVFLPESNQAYIDSALQLMEGQRVFVSGVVVNGSRVTQTGTIRDRYTIFYPTSFVPLDNPAAEPVQQKEEAIPEPEPEPVVQPQPKLQQQVVQQAPRVVEMEGTAKPTSAVRNNSQQPGSALRPRTVTVPRSAQSAQAVEAAPAAQETVQVTVSRPTVSHEPEPIEGEDDLNYDPFAEP